MEQKNENELLLIKNYSNFLIDLGLNISFSLEHDLKNKQSKPEKNFKSIKDIDSYVEEWQIKNNIQLILRNNNMSSKFLLLLSEKNNFTNFVQPKIKQGLLEKMFSSIGQNLDDFFIINIDIKKEIENHKNKINEILELYFTILNPKIFVDMYSDDLNKLFDIDNLNLNFDYIKIPAVSNIIKNPSLKREAWVQLKLLKEKLDEF